MFYTIRNRLLNLKERYANRSFTAGEFTKIIRRQFPAADFSFRTHKDYAVDPDMVVVAGIYDCYNDSEHLPYIEITLCYHPEQETYFGNLIDWDQLSFDIAECVGHELIHRKQYKTKQKLKEYPSDNADQAYLGHEEEIDAYGFSIAAESIIYNKPIYQCAMYQAYQNTFDKDRSVVLKLEQQIIKYLRELELENEQTNSI